MYQISSINYANGMKKVEDLRLENARTLLRQFRTLIEFADEIDRSATQVSRLMGKNPHKIIGSKMARHIEQRMNLPEGWLDTDHGQASKPDTVPSEEQNSGFFPATNFALHYPLINKAQASAWDSTDKTALKAAKHYPCPIKCSGHTFVLEVEGISMYPDYKEGYLIWVDPNVNPASKSLVLVHIEKRDDVTFKQLIVEDGIKFLQPLNDDWPEKIIYLNDDDRVLGVVVFSGFLPR